MPKLSFSIITVTYNSQEFLEDCMKSVLQQTYSNYEYIVVDGNSTDKTLDLIREYEPHFDGKMKWISEDDCGLYDAMNKGLNLAKNDIVAFINSDDLYANVRTLEIIAEQFTENPFFDACYCDVAHVSRHDLARITRLWSMPINAFAKFQFGWCPGHPSVFVRREIYQKYGGFDISFKIAADFELLCRFIAKHNIRIKHVPEVLVKMREGGLSNSTLRSIVSGNLECYRALRKHGIFPYFIWLKPLRKAMQVLRGRAR